VILYEAADDRHLGLGVGEEMTRKGGGASPDVCPEAPDTLATPLCAQCAVLILTIADDVVENQIKSNQIESFV